MTDKDKKKLTASLILLIVAAVALGIGIYLLISFIKNQRSSPLFLLPITMYIILISISFHLNRSYRKDNSKPGALSTTLLVLSYVLFPLFATVLRFFKLWSLLDDYSTGLKTVIVTGADGKKYILMQTYYDSIYYKDQFGDEWVTYDGGQTFKRHTEDIKVKDEKGNEHTLTPIYSYEYSSPHYKDKDGEVWMSKDGEQTFEHIITKAKAKDKDGNEYNLMATGAPGRFIDQNGDSWITYDEGKTFERWN